MVSTGKLLANSATRDIVFMFLDNLPLRVQKIKQDIKSDSRIELKHRAHELRDTAANLGFSDISNAAGVLEDYAEDSSLSSLRNYVTEVEFYSMQIANNLRSIH